MSDLDEQIERTAAQLGVKLEAWQREFLRLYYAGDRIVWSRGRRGGWTTVQRVVRAINEEESS